MANLMKFFEALSERAYKENDLSDVTYALLMADVTFRKFFLDFFFHDANLDARHVTIEREHSDAIGRPDFWIKDKNGNLYLVEVKIWDGNHHFEQYYDILAGNKESDKVSKRDDKKVWRRLGYIANYNSVKTIEVEGNEVKDLGCSVHTWKEFVEELKDTSMDPQIVGAYVQYLKQVCPFDDFTINCGWNINKEHFIAIKNFNAAVNYAVNNPDIGCFVYTSYGSSRRFRSQQWMGQYFVCKLEDGMTIRGWLGVYYRKNGAIVCIDFDNDNGGDQVCKLYPQYVQDGHIRFYAKNSKDMATNKEILKDFLAGVLSKIKNSEPAINGNESYCFNDEDIEYMSKDLLAVKCLPFALENHFITDEFRQIIAKAGYDFALVSGNDEEVPESHCGRYFELKYMGKGLATVQKVATYRGWIGVDYNENCKRLDSGVEGDDYLRRPAFILELPKDFPGTADIKQENTWGWKCIELVEDKRKWDECFKEARERLLNLLTQNQVKVENLQS